MELEREIDQVIEKMTLEEKISMIHGSGIFRTGAVERLGIPALKMSDGPMGVRNEMPDASLKPVGYTDDFVTYNPSNSALAATWNPERAYECGKVLGEEARGRGKDVILAPGINIKRDPLCGRNFEYMSEDPCLIENLTVPFIKGIQENDVAACVKHFAANGQETDRFMVDTVVDERTLQEIYFPGFKAAVQKGGSYSVMNAYNKLNGTHCSENQWLLDKILREEWGYDGTVISDWDSVHTTREAAEASVDVEMGIKTDFDNYFFADPLLKAVREGEVPEEKIDRKVRNILRMMYRLKMIGSEAKERKSGTYNTPEHRKKALAAARESIVLLKNQDGILPIAGEKLRMEEVTAASENEAAEAAASVNSRLRAPRKKRIALIGKNAEYNHAAGGGSAEIKSLYEISPLMGLKKELGGNVEISYAPGYFIPGEKEPNTADWEHASLERRIMGSKAEKPVTEGQKKLSEEILKNRAKYRKEACELAKSADIVIFVGGQNHDYDQEGRDRDEMKLPYAQDELIEALLDVNPDTIVVMISGSPVEMPWLERVKGLIWCYYSGLETGTALAEILLGKINPSAKLPETFPVRYSDTATAKNGEFGKTGKIELKEGIFVGYRYYEKEHVKPAFPFGFGLSYTTFEIGDPTLQLSKPQDLGSETERNSAVKRNAGELCVKLSVSVTNTGDKAGAEVVQCYVSDPECSVDRPLKELKAFCKVFLKPGETKRVEMELPYGAFAFFDEKSRKFVTEPGEFLIFLGNSSENCGLKQTIEI